LPRLLQILASRLQHGEDAIYLELMELAEQQQQQGAGAAAVVGATGSSSTAVALVPPVAPALQLEKELEGRMMQAAQRIQRLDAQ
jgi:hypothetical protein